MIFRASALFGILLFAAAWGELPYVSVGASPDDPAAGTDQTRYRPVMTGTKNFQPVEPMPWGDANRRVAPPAPRKSAQ